MAEETIKNKLSHSLILEERSRLSLTGVTDVESFDETAIAAYTDYGELTINGTQLHIGKLNVEDGQLCVEGNITSLTYVDRAPKSTSFFGKMFR